MDRSLATLLRSLHSSVSYGEVERLLPTASSLLCQLTNPLNVTLLTSQLLANDLVYPYPTDLRHSRRIFSIFYSAALRTVQNNSSKDDFVKHISPDAWAKAVVKGADDQSPRWRHVLLLGGVLLGLEGQQQQPVLSRDLRMKLEGAVVSAANLTLEDVDRPDDGAKYSLIFVLNHTFALLSDAHRARLNYARLLLVSIPAVFFSNEGLGHGYWLASIDKDVQETVARRFAWSVNSPSFLGAQTIKSSVLISNLGPLSRLLAHTMDNVRDPLLVMECVDQLADFARTLATSWRQNKLSEIEPTEEKDFLDSSTLHTTLPMLLQILRDTFFAVIILLRSALGRVLCDPILASDAHAPLLAMQTLHILRHFQFVAGRFGQTSTSQYAFVNFTALDMLSQYPEHTRNFLHAIRLSQLGEIPPHTLDRSYDLFFLNAAEHLTLAAGPSMSEDLLLASAMPYVSDNDLKGNVENYEAAHSLLLAIFATPNCSDLASRHLPFYMESVMQNFPSKLSPRQFRLAVKSIARIAAPPSRVFDQEPLLQPVLLDIIATRATSASDKPLPPAQSQDVGAQAHPLTEQATLVLALIDCLPFLPVPMLLDWLTQTAETINKIADSSQRDTCQQRFWEAMSNGEMDVERATACVTWWNTRNGRELTLYNDVPEEDHYLMTGAVQQPNKL